MAIREFRYTVTPDSIAGTTVSKGGVQKEHQATKVIFEISDALASKLSSLKGEDDSKTLLYRFDLYDGAGGKESTEPISFDPDDATEFSHLITEKQTRYGGTIQVYFVITLVSEDETELELYSYCVRLMLKALPNGVETEGEDYESITTLAVEVRNNANEVAKANESMQSVLNGTWIFDGGDAENTTEFVVSDEITEGGKNLVRSGVIKVYVDKTSAEKAETALENYKTPEGKSLEHIDTLDETTTDLKNRSYIIAEGDITTDEISHKFNEKEISKKVQWHYRKWNNGYFELYGKTVDPIEFTTLSTSGQIYYGECGEFPFPDEITVTEILSLSCGFIDTSGRNVWTWCGSVTTDGIGQYFVGRGTDTTDNSITPVNGYPTVHIMGKYEVGEVAE